MESFFSGFAFWIFCVILYFGEFSSIIFLKTSWSMPLTCIFFLEIICAYNLKVLFYHGVPHLPYILFQCFFHIPQLFDMGFFWVFYFHVDFSYSSLQYHYLLVEEFCSQVLDCLHHICQPYAWVFLCITQVFFPPLIISLSCFFVSLNSLNALMKFMVFLLNSVFWVHAGNSHWQALLQGW